MNKDTEKFTTTFQPYIVAYIDVLGQKAELAKLEKLLDNGERTGEPVLEAKRQTIDVVKKIRKDFHKFWEQVIAPELKNPEHRNLTEEQKPQFKRLRYGDIKFKYISDGIIIYAPLMMVKGEQRVQDILSIVMATAHLIFVNLSKKVAIRGAVELSWATKLESWTKNKEDADIYGPVLTRVHYLENKVADYPRIIVGHRLIDVLERWLRLPYKEEDNTQERLNKICAKSCRSLIYDDMDGQFIVDFLGPFMQKYTGTSHLAKAGYNFVQSEYIRYRQLARDSQGIDSQAKYSKLASRYANLIGYFLQRLPHLDSESLDE